MVTEKMVNAADSVLSRYKPGIPDDVIRLAIAAAISCKTPSAKAWTQNDAERENEGLKIDASNHAADAETVRREREVERQRADAAEAEVNRLRERLGIGPQGEDAIDVAESCEGFLRHRILTAEAEVNRIKDVIGVEILPRLHLTRVFAGDMTERNWADKKDYIIQQVDWSLIAAAALSSTGDTHGY